MRARITKEPTLQANSANYGTRTVLTHKPEERKRRGYGSRALEVKADRAMKELNNLFEIN
jgi:hypothetical protein